MSKYILIGKEYRLNDSDHPTYDGQVFASDSAFFFVVRIAMSLADLKGRAGYAGIVGSIAAGVQSHTRDPERERLTEQTAKETFSCQPSEVPKGITCQMDWMATGKEDYPVLRVPRAAVLSMEMHWFWLNNRLNIQTEKITFGIVYRFFAGRQIRRFLVDQGWPLS
jgi:hypothetical protein